MARIATLSDAEILHRARMVFARRGYAARTREVSAAVGLTWGAIIRRFHDKRSLFDKAMAPSPAAVQHHGCLQSLLEQLYEQLCCQWPLQLHRRLAALADDDSRTGLSTVLASALSELAEQGKQVRTDLSPAVLAGLVLNLMTGDIAQRVVDGHIEVSPDPLLVERVVRLLCPCANSEAPGRR